MPRFVILEHDHPHVHWDLMLEAGATLRTWRLSQPPSLGEIIAAESLGDHRTMYLDYEGPVSGNRGKVRRWDLGAFEGQLPAVIQETEQLKLMFRGQRLAGIVSMQALAGTSWSFLWEKSEGGSKTTCCE